MSWALPEPMLAEPVSRPVLPAGWAAEPKWDGYRAGLLVGRGGRVVLRSRRGAEMAAEFPEIVRAGQEELSEGCALGGTSGVDDGKPMVPGGGGRRDCADGFLAPAPGPASLAGAGPADPPFRGRVHADARPGGGAGTARTCAGLHHQRLRDGTGAGAALLLPVRVHHRRRLHSLFALERAFGERLGSKKPLQKLVERAANEGIITVELAGRLDASRSLRNKLAHGDLTGTALTPAIAVAMVKAAFDTAGLLFPGPAEGSS